MKRFLFGALWFVGLWIGGGVIGGAIVAMVNRSDSPTPATDVASGYAQGQAVGKEFGRKYGGLILIGALVVAVAGTAFGILPGTRQAPPKPAESKA